MIDDGKNSLVEVQTFLYLLVQLLSNTNRHLSMKFSSSVKGSAIQKCNWNAKRILLACTINAFELPIWN